MPRFAVAKVMPFSELANFCGKKMDFFSILLFAEGIFGEKMRFRQHFARP
jgi:hypothetical protein